MIRFIEIGFTPLLKSAYPEETLWVDTRFSWNDSRGMQPVRERMRDHLSRIYSEIRAVLAIPKKSGIEAVVVRARGSENSIHLGPNYLVKKALGFALQKAAIDLASKHQCKLAVIDRRDEVSVHINDTALLRHCDVFFKRELPWSTWSLFEQMIPPRICIGSASQTKPYLEWAKKFRPISLGIEDELVAVEPTPIISREFDVFFTGTTHSLTRRHTVKREIDSLTSQGLKVNAPAPGLPRPDFLHSIQSARIAISPGGVGWDCYRHYEIPAQGTALLLENPCNQMYKAPRHGIDAILYNPAEPIGPILRSLLADADALQRISSNGHRWLKQNHTFTALGSYIADTLRSGS